MVLSLKSFTAAAAKLYVSQPCLSAAIKKIEQQIGRPLFERRTGDLTPTKIGYEYLACALKMMEIEDKLRENHHPLFSVPRSTMNIGIVDNQGYEVELGWKDNVGEFRYSIDANVTYARNEIVYMDEVKSEFDYQNMTGGSTGRNDGLYKFIRLYNYDDFYIDENGVQRLNPDLPQPSATVYPGDCMYADISGDGVVDGEDTMVYGFADRPEYMFGSNWKFSWKGFNLNLNWIAATNVHKMLEVEYRIPFTNSGNRGLLDYFYRDCWTTENPNGTLPRAAEKSESWNSAPSTLWLRDASYIRLKSAQFGYTFGRNKFFDRMGINSLNVSFTGYNLLTFTKLTFQDPETVSNNDGVYPLVKTYNLSLNINF